jgi:hypothetical protein
MPQVMAQSGHRDPKSVMRYTNLSGNYLANELAKAGLELHFIYHNI